MNAVAVPKSPSVNRLEGLALSAALMNMPTFAGAAMLLKLVGSSAIVGDTGGAAFFVIAASIFGAILAAWQGPKYPRFFAASYEPAFFDASLSVKEKTSRWIAQPKAAQQLATSAILLSILGTALASIG